MKSKTKEKGTRLLWLIRTGRLPQAVGYGSKFLLGRSLYIDHLATYLTTDDIPVRVEGNTMFLSPSDSGISAELFHFGTREQRATAIMRSEFERIRRNVDQPTVLEIGANRGYYAFLAADVLGENARIIALEPDPENFEALNKGIDANGFGTISATRCAVGDEDTTETLNIAETSNSHTLQSVDEDDDKYTGETVETPVRRIPTLIEDRGLQPEDIDVVRMDVEGFESAVFRGMGKLLNADSELLVFVELHPHRVPATELDSIITDLEDGGFEFVHASSSAKSDLKGFDAVRRHLQTPKGRHTVELIAKRGETTEPASVSGERLVAGTSEK